MKGGSLSDVGTGVGVLFRPGGQGKRVATIAAFLVESRFRLSRFEMGQENQSIGLLCETSQLLAPHSDPLFLTL